MGFAGFVGLLGFIEVYRVQGFGCRPLPETFYCNAEEQRSVFRQGLQGFGQLLCLVFLPRTHDLKHPTTLPNAQNPRSSTQTPELKCLNI